MIVDIKAEVHPTEDTGRVEKAITRLFPDAINIKEGAPELLVMVTHDIQAFINRMGEQKILDTARAILLRGARESVLIFHLNKQAAYCGKVNFTDGGSLLGDITVIIRDENPRKLAESMTEVGD